jgi:uncharacterized protein
VSASLLLPAVEQHVRSLMEGEGTGHDWWHVDRVRRSALAIAEHEGADRTIVELAALLHDIADWKFAGGDIDAGPRAARELLTRLEADLATIEHVCQIIDRLSFKGAGVDTTMPTLEGKCVQDADRLDAIGAIGVARAFAYGGHKGRPLYDPRVPPEMHADFAAYRRKVGPTLNHFYEKLLLLKDRMQTDEGRRRAAERHAYLERFLEQFLAEWDGHV